MKRLISILVLISLIFSFSACGKTPSDNTSQSVEIVYEEQEVVYEVEDTNSSDLTSSKEESNVSNQESDLSSTNGLQENSSQEEASSSIQLEDTSNTQENICYLNDTQTLNNIKLNGRCEKNNNGIGLNLTASAIEFNTNSSNVLLEVNADANVYYSIFVDGELTKERGATEIGINYIALARGLSSGTHNIKFVRETEARGGNTLTAVNIQLDEGSSLFAKDSDKVLIEFLGDSLTNGYGNLTNSSTSGASDLKYQNSLKAYPYLMANQLDLDYRIVAMSGIALKERPMASGTYPTFYNFYSLENYHKDKTQAYTSSSPQDVDIVVVNLGTNDLSANLYSSSNADSVEEYATLYTELITKIGYRTDAKIVFVSGVSSCHAQQKAYDAAKTKLNAQGYNNVYVKDIPTYDSGGEKHPSADEHKIIADELVKFFKENGIA